MILSTLEEDAGRPNGFLFHDHFMHGAVAQGDDVRAALHGDARFAGGQVDALHQATRHGVDARYLAPIDTEMDLLAVRPDGRVHDQLVGDVIGAEGEDHFFADAGDDVFVLPIRVEDA